MYLLEPFKTNDTCFFLLFYHFGTGRLEMIGCGTLEEVQSLRKRLENKVA